MYILGLTTLGDAAATLVADGEVVAAVEEERFSRQKHHAGFPFRSVEYCLAEAGIKIGEVDHVSLYWKPWVLGHKAVQALRALAVSRDRFKARADGVSGVSRSYLGMLGYSRLIREHFGASDFRFHYLEHHQCHAASAFFVSPFETAAILTMDGTGEATTTLTAVGEGNDFRPLKRIKLPHSLGQFYSAVTNFLGFDMYEGDEWKVMGLAAYGEPEYKDFFSSVLRTRGPDGFRLDWRVLDHHLAKNYQFPDELTRVLGAPRQAGEEITERHRNIAASAQVVLEDVVLHLLRALHRRTGEANLCLAGGVAFNSVMNGRILRESPHRAATSWSRPTSGPRSTRRSARPLSRRPTFPSRPSPTTSSCLAWRVFSPTGPSWAGSRAAWSSGPGPSGTGASSPTPGAPTCANC